MTGNRVRELQVLHLRHQLSEPIQTTMGPVRARPALLIRLEDDQGAHGWGEVWCNFPPGGDFYRAELAANVLPAALADMHLDDAEPSRHIERKLHRLTLQAGEPGPIRQLAAAVDIAVHDLRARRKGIPLAVELGGELRPVPAYASGISAALHESQVLRMRALGFRHFKQRIGYGKDDGLPQLQACAAGLEADERLMADANQAWDLTAALQHSQLLDSLSLAWLEEPLPADAGAADWHTLARQMSTPLAGGENLRDDDSFISAIKAGDLHILQPDICKWGGLSGGHRIATLALANGRRYCPHYLGGGIGLLASAHLLSAVGGDGLLEVDSSDNPLQLTLAGGRIALDNERFHIPSGPGLGIEPDITGLSALLVSDVKRSVQPS
ncbi:mandelate racemase/muconate lactonizing enzyme family protein [Granulosicoccus sp. 3-233]|uniref:mandelate racemase/muconate lactonizing enzyme family protein n=1 Tax=Granulosicoccus sp. 3-233 TaxID=3417969 RepID=UPI003D34ACFA